MRAFRARERAEGPKHAPAYWSDIEQVADDICVAVFSYLDGDQVRAKMETFRGIDNYSDAGRWLSTMKREYLEPCETRAQRQEPEMKYRYEVTPRAADLGGGWNLKMFENDVEVGGGVFPLEGADNPDYGVDWWNAMTEDVRAHWLSVAGTAVPADAWLACLANEAERAAVEAGEEWLSSASGTFD